MDITDKEFTNICDSFEGCQTCIHNECCVFIYEFKYKGDTHSLQPNDDFDNNLSVNNIHCGHYLKGGTLDNYVYLRKWKEKLEKDET